MIFASDTDAYANAYDTNSQIQLKVGEIVRLYEPNFYQYGMIVAKDNSDVLVKTYMSINYDMKISMPCAFDLEWFRERDIHLPIKTVTINGENVRGCVYQDVLFIGKFCYLELRVDQVKSEVVSEQVKQRFLKNVYNFEKKSDRLMRHLQDQATYHKEPNPVQFRIWRNPDIWMDKRLDILHWKLEADPVARLKECSDPVEMHEIMLKGMDDIQSNAKLSKELERSMWYEKVNEFLRSYEVPKQLEDVRQIQDTQRAYYTSFLPLVTKAYHQMQ